MDSGGSSTSRALTLALALALTLTRWGLSYDIVRWMAGSRLVYDFVHNASVYKRLL